MPFSIFERSESKEKLSSVSQRYGFQTTFTTITSPEQDDMSILKLSIIRELKAYNVSTIKEKNYAEKLIENFNERNNERNKVENEEEDEDEDENKEEKNVLSIL